MPAFLYFVQTLWPSMGFYCVYLSLFTSSKEGEAIPLKCIGSTYLLLSPISNYKIPQVRPFSFWTLGPPNYPCVHCGNTSIAIIRKVAALDGV